MITLAENGPYLLAILTTTYIMLAYSMKGDKRDEY